VSECCGNGRQLTTWLVIDVVMTVDGLFWISFVFSLPFFLSAGCRGGLFAGGIRFGYYNNILIPDDLLITNIFEA
jgi:hypothetical protein